MVGDRRRKLLDFGSLIR
ncbi:hypothetical protein Golob_008863, partial [Gossypium lobatum]|nr:hypothetical protein [Gossypium lobatum]